VIGFSSGDDYEYDWDNVDWSKPQSEWPRLYFKPEKGFKNNYVYSDLAGIDAAIQLTDSTTEGANLSAIDFLPEWCVEHGFEFGADVTAPWVWSDGRLLLWFENSSSTDVENLPNSNNVIINGNYIYANGLVEVYNMQGMLVAKNNDVINTNSLQSGVYVIKTTNSTIKLLVP
jgi:hypothetical protein